MAKVDEAVINFAVYENAVEYYGLAQADLPPVNYITEEISGAGIAGKTESVILGHLEAMSLGLKFRTITKESIALHEPRNHTLDLRAPQQSRDTVSGRVIKTTVKHVFVVFPKNLNPGKVAPASPADVSGEYAVSYWATFIDGKMIMEIDVLNFIYFVNGTDYLAGVRKAMGK